MIERGGRARFPSNMLQRMAILSHSLRPKQRDSGRRAGTHNVSPDTFLFLLCPHNAKFPSLHSAFAASWRRL